MRLPAAAPNQPALSLTKRQQDVLNAINAYFDEQHVPPSRADLAAKTGLSVMGVQYQLSELAKKGAIVLLPKVARGIRICVRRDASLNV